MEERTAERFESSFTFADGAKRYFLLSVAPIPEGIFIFSLDITERVRAEEELKRHRDRLDELVEFRTRELKQISEALREADRRKDDFIAALSHELRNPLMPIQNSVYILNRVAPDSDQAKRALAVIERQADHLNRIVDDLLDVARVVQGKIRLRPRLIDLREIAARAIEDHRSIFTEAGIELTVSLPDGQFPLYGDPMRLSQVLADLLQNAAKFTGRGGRVVVSLEQANGAGRIRVRDNGLGMSADLLGRIFRPFVQADTSLERSGGGLGLGLALVKGVVELHGGTVSARSEGEGLGSEFIVEFPPVPARGPGLPAT
jgi:signal transduction histidine kinase